MAEAEQALYKILGGPHDELSIEGLRKAERLAQRHGRFHDGPSATVQVVGVRPADVGSQR